MAQLKNIKLIIIGEGPAKEGLVRLIHELGVEGRVKLLGNVAQDELVTYYNAADALVLASVHGKACRTFSWNVWLAAHRLSRRRSAEFRK